MSQLDWTPGDTVPDRQGYYETRLDTGYTAISLYSVLGWRALPPAAEKEEAERHLQEIRAAQSHVPMDY
jgi:hypothetical protein